MESEFVTPQDMEFLSILRCPRTGQGLRRGDGQWKGALVCEDGRVSYSERNGIWVFVEESEGADFGEKN